MGLAASFALLARWLNNRDRLDPGDRSEVCGALGSGRTTIAWRSARGADPTPRRLDCREKLLARFARDRWYPLVLFPAYCFVA